MSQTIRRPYTASDVCEALGISLDTLYRTRARWHARERLPQPISERPLRWERTGFDAWLTRHHPARPNTAAANDAAPLPVPGTIEEHQADLHAYYQARRGQPA
jgi:predicted DNA-binding transcriptional regulator AlpA